MRHLFALLTASAVALATGSLAMAEEIPLKATMAGATEVPPKTGDGMGTMTGSFDTQSNVLKWHVTYSGLSGDVTAGHFHGPADPATNAGVQVPFKMPVTSPFDGQATLNPQQGQDLLAGKWYINLHTKANPGGEIRGQVKSATETPAK